MTKITRISLETARNLDHLVELLGKNKVEILEMAVDFYLREQFLKKANEEFAHIKATRKFWVAEMKERQEWEASLNDGLSDEK